MLGTRARRGLRAVIAEPRITEEALRNAFETAGRAAVHRLERYLNTLGTIASAAPLLGLLGTVIGMIEIFGSQAPTGGNNPAHARARHLDRALQHRLRPDHRDPGADVLPLLPRPASTTTRVDMEQAADRMVPHLMRFAVPRASRPERAAR